MVRLLLDVLLRRQLPDASDNRPVLFALAQDVLRGSGLDGRAGHPLSAHTGLHVGADCVAVVRVPELLADRTGRCRPRADWHRVHSRTGVDWQTGQTVVQLLNPPNDLKRSPNDP